MNKLELGCGKRPTKGYLHQDIRNVNSFPIDFIGDEWTLKVKDNSLEEVIAIGVIEHLTFLEVHNTFIEVFNKLSKDGIFLFDVPDFEEWINYAFRMFNGLEFPFTEEKIYGTLFGWQRWAGDEHKSGWTKKTLTSELTFSGFNEIEISPNVINEFWKRNIFRNRFRSHLDAHLYIKARK